MDSQSVLHRLEEAAKVLLAPPNFVSKEQRREAENIFLEFRKFSFPYETCRFVLEHSKNEYAQFQAACTIKSSIVREWAALPAHDVEHLRLFLLQYVTSHLSLLPYVREEIFQTLAVIVKRGILESDAISKNKIFNEVTQLISTGDLSMQLIACSLLTALLNEFSSNCKTGGTGFTWEFHIRCKRHFEENHLHQALLFTLQVLNELVKCETPFGREQLPVMMRFLSIAEQILQWEFLPAKLTRRHMVPFGFVNQSPFRPPLTWKGTVLNSDFLALFFNLYSKVHYHSGLSHHAVQCIAQLASLNGPIFNESHSQLSYLREYVATFNKTIKGLVLQDYDALSIATVYENLLNWYKVQSFSELSPSIINPFIQCMTSITCQFIAKAFATETSIADDNLYDEALEKILCSWTSLLTDSGKYFGPGQFKKQATEIFNSYIESHIHSSPAAGVNSNENGATLEEFETEDTPDKERFSEQLTSIGILGREVPEHSLPTLARVIDARNELLKVELEQLSDRMRSSKGQTQPQIHNNRLDNIYDDLHWLILIATSVLTDGDTSGEKPLIPDHILKYSISQTNHIDAQQTLNLIVQPELSSSQATQVNRVDSTVRLISSILRLFYIQSIAVQSNLGHSLSPQLASTCMHFMRRFIKAYLILEESDYEQVSLSLHSIFGKDTPGSNCFINLILDKIKLNLSIWNSEPEVVEECLETLISLVSSKNICTSVIKCSNFATFISAISMNSYPFNSLPASCKRLLYRAIVYCGLSIGEHQVEFWENMVNKPMTEFTQLVSSESFKSAKDEPLTREAVIHGLEMLIGCCQACKRDNPSLIFETVEPAFQATIHVLDSCHLYEQLVELSLEVFCVAVSSMVCLLDSLPSERMYEHCLAAIQAYAKHNPPGLRKADPDMEEEKFRDILLILKFLNSLMYKELIDFGAVSSGHVLAVTAAEVVLFGLTVIVPLIDLSLLQFPNLCSEYYKLITCIAELSPEKLLEQPVKLLEPILSSVLLSLNRYGSDIAKNGFEFLTGVAMHVARSKNSELAEKSKLENFLQPVLNILLFESFDMDLCDIISGTLFYLTIIYPVKFHKMQCCILEEQKDKAHYYLLQQSLAKLSDGGATHKSGSRLEKQKFVATVKQVLLEVKGFLCVI